MAEQLTRNEQVVSSILTSSSMIAYTVTHCANMKSAVSALEKQHFSLVWRCWIYRCLTRQTGALSKERQELAAALSDAARALNE